MTETSGSLSADPILEISGPPPVTNLHTFQSSHREHILEHYFVGEVLRYIWKHHRDECPPEVTYSDVDNCGYDIIIEWRLVTRHIQLKSTVRPDSPIRVNTSLIRKRCGCVVLMECNDDLAQVTFAWLGNSPEIQLSLPYKPAKHTRANSDGVKRESISAVKVPRGAFVRLSNVQDLVERLFPLPPVSPLPGERTFAQ